MTMFLAESTLLAVGGILLGLVLSGCSAMSRPTVAQFELLQAQQALADLETEAETARIQAMQEIITYEKAVRDAQYALDNFTIPTNQANLDTVEALNLMKQRLENAQNQLAAAQVALDQLTITAPFSGVVARFDIHAGEWVIPGQVVLVLADLDHLRVETTDLSERDVPQVAVGQKVSIFIEALGKTINGQVSAIAPLADTLGGDVVYRTTIDLDAHPPDLRAGMSVEVQFGGG